MRQISSPGSEIIIVGGGHAGLSMAACLGTAGFHVLCLERAGPPRQKTAPFDGRTLALSFRSVQLLKKAGVWASLEPNACPILDIRVADQAAPLHLDFHHQDVGDAPFGWIVENVFFKNRLEKRIKQLPNVTMVYGAVVEHLDLTPSHRRVILANGEVYQAPLIIAADGRSSTCRHLLGIETYGWDYRQVAVVCTIGHDMPHNNVAVEHFLPGGPFATLPMTQNRSSIVWTEKTAAAQALMAMDKEDFTVILQEKVEPYLGRIHLLGERFAYPLSLLHAKSYRAPRVVLVGDAAHGIHPIAGQGFNLGMGDIEILFEELTQAQRLGLDLGSAAILQRYEKRRKFDDTAMVVMTDILDRLFSNALPPVQAVRRLGLGMVQNLPTLRKFFMRTAMGLKPEASLRSLHP